MAVEIWKFSLEGLVADVKMPTHARVLSCAYQGENLRVWAIVVPSNPQQWRRFNVVMTGQETVLARGPFVGTAFHPRGLVMHVFDAGYINTKPEKS